MQDPLTRKELNDMKSSKTKMKEKRKKKKVFFCPKLLSKGLVLLSVFKTITFIVSRLRLPEAETDSQGRRLNDSKFASSNWNYLGSFPSNFKQMSFQSASDTEREETVLKKVYS